MTTRRRRVDLDDADDVPDFVSQATAPEKPIPQCLRCGGTFPKAKALWIICEECEERELRELSAKCEVPMTRHPQGTHAMIGELARKVALSFGQGDGDRTPLPPAAVLHHEARFLARGLDPGAARRLAEALATDPSHRAGCAICQGDLVAIVEHLEKPSQETERLEQIGREHLPRRGRRS